jgi:eukaryotic-like serine/threonine-protein kinase
VTDAPETRHVGRYVLFDEIAAGGMATVHFGRFLGPGGFARTVAIKRLHPQYAKDPEFVSMFLDEARVAARIRHPNVVPTLDIVTEAGEMLLVMEYVNGASLSHLMRDLRSKGEAVPPAIAAGILAGALAGLHAAHEATSEHGGPLDLVHRDVSPQNLLVGTDGVTRVVDFGIAKAVGRLQTTREGQVKGKVGYMSPEQVRARPIDRRADVYAAGVVLWEALAGARLFTGDAPIAIMNQVLEKVVEPPSRVRAGVPAALDAVVMKAVARKPDARWATAREMVVALENAVRIPSPREIGEWVSGVAGEIVSVRAARVREIESYSSELAAAAGAAALAREPESDAVGGPVPLSVEVGTTEVDEHAPGPRAHRWRRRSIVAGAAILLGGTALLLGLHRDAGGVVRAAADASSGVPSVASSPVAASTTVDVRAPRPAEDSSAAAPVVPRPSGAAPSVRRRPAAGDKARCAPPYTIDASGVRHWKDGC